MVNGINWDYLPVGTTYDYGIIVRMYFAPGEHPPPHFHAYYAEHTAVVDNWVV